MKSLLASGLALACLSVAAFAFGGAEEIDRTMEISAVGRMWTLDELRSNADVIVVGRHDGVQSEHWTSRDNHEWVAAPDSGVVPLVVRDEKVVVLTSLRGAKVDEEIFVRGIGGTADRVHLDFHGMDELQDGQIYLLFLKRVDWPTKEGFDEGVLTPVGHGQGIFRWVDGGFENSLAIRIVHLSDVDVRD